MSSADNTYMADMATHQKNAVTTATTYLQAGPADRRANITDQARGILATAAGCCCGGEGCACCGAGCCYDGCCCCKPGCSCGDAADSTALATT